MRANSTKSNWTAGNAYEAFMGRWSYRLAEKFLRWLGSEPGLTWLDVGCGTGALVSAISNFAEPSLAVGCDPSEAFIKHARTRIMDSRVKLMIAGIGNPPNIPGGFDRVVSGLVLNFLPDQRKSIEGMRECACQGGTVAAYVWDYAGRMQYLRIFWDEVVAMDPAARELDEGVRFQICKPEALELIFQALPE